MRKSPAPERARLAVHTEVIDIGKDVVELFTTGMYVAPATIYREYTQNAADSIDEARALGQLGVEARGDIQIELNHATRSVKIRDNGVGIAREDVVRRLLAVGGSPKRGTFARGFRGIGRLAGLAYCRRLEFTTKAIGEPTITSVTWDCQALRQRLADNAFSGDLKDIIAEAVSVEYRRAEIKEQSFFEVNLHDVIRLRNDLLLNENLVTHYLAQVGPIPFAPEFSFGPAIEERLAQHFAIAPINLRINGETVYRPYRDETMLPGSQQKLRIEEIEFMEFADVDGEVGALGWIAHHQYARSLPSAPGVRGLRARVGNLQIGDDSIFSLCFRESRFNSWCVGETHIVDRRILPNARRDNFVVNHHYYNLLAQVGPIAARLAQQCRHSSISRNAMRSVRNSLGELNARLAEGRNIDPTEFARLRAAVTRARSKVKKIMDEAVCDAVVAELDRIEGLLFARPPIQGASTITFDEVVALVSKVVTNRRQVDRIIRELRDVCRMVDLRTPQDLDGSLG